MQLEMTRGHQFLHRSAVKLAEDRIARPILMSLSNIRFAAFWQDRRQRGTDMERRTFLKTAGAATLGASSLSLLKVLPASAATNGVAVVAISQTINSLDIHRKGTNRPSYQIAVNLGGYFVRDHFVQALPQTKIISKYSNTPTVHVSEHHSTATSLRSPMCRHYRPI